jgi:hypothetical protein
MFMSTIASCPRCAQQVTIPGGAASSETVRCPLCNAEYPLAEAMAKAPPTLVVISSLAVVAPEPPAENEAELHLFPAAESPYDFVDSGSGSNELELDHANGLPHDAPVVQHDSDVAPHDTHEAPLMAEVHGQAVSEPPADHFAAAEADVLELPSDDLSVDAPAAAETEQGDFLASFDEHEPAAGAAEGEFAATAGHLPTEEAPQAPELGTPEADWLGEDLAESEAGGHEPAGFPSDALGEAPPEQEAEELSFGEDESLGIGDGEPGFDTVNLDSGFEERRPIPEDVEGYALDHESAEGEASEEETAAAADAPARPARRKPSKVFSVIMYLFTLLVVLPAVYLIYMWSLTTDPLQLAPYLPGMIVPASLNANAKLAQRIPPSAITPGPGTSDDPIQKAPAAQDGSPVATNPAGGASAGGAAPGDEKTDPAGSSGPDAGDGFLDAPDDANMPADPGAGDAADSDAEEPDPADAAAMAADAAAHDPDAGPADADLPAKEGDDDAPAKEADDADMAADRDAAADSEPADADAKDMAAKDDDDAAAKEADDADMAADRDATAASEPADAKDRTAKDDDDDADDADDAAAKKTAAKETDDSPVGAALEEAMTDDDAADAATVVGPRDSVQYTPADVDQALTDVASASKAMDEAAKGDEKKARARAKGQFYRKLYQLAEVATFTPSMAASAEAEQGSQQDEVGHTLVGSAASPVKFDEVGKAAAQWLEAVKGKEHQGIVLTGTLKSTAQRGKVFESEVLLTDGQHVVTVLSPAAPNAGKLSAVLVWGSVEKDPAENIVGYEGEAKTAVWTTAVEQAPPGAAWKPVAPAPVK